MNIVYLHQYFNTPAQPGGTRSYEFARRLAARGHTVNMVTSVREFPVSRGWHQSVIDGIYVHAIPVLYANTMSYRQRIAAFLRFAYHAARRAARLKPDIVFATSTPLTIALPAVYAARRRSVPMVFEVRDLWPEMPIAIGALKGRIPISLAQGLERFAYRNASRIVALSPGMKDGIVSTGYPESHVHVIPNACDLDLFDAGPTGRDAFRERLPWLHDRPLVTYIGTLGALNGVGYLIEVAAACMYLAPAVRFLIVGKGKDKPNVESLAHERGLLGKTVFFMDPVPKADVPAILDAADLATSLFIDLPPMWKNSANKFFDALASGTPIAINHEGWQADLLRESGAGLVLPARDPAAAAALLAAFLDNPDRVAQAGQAARHLAETRFSRDLLFDDFERVLLLAAEEHRTR